VSSEPRWVADDISAYHNGEEVNGDNLPNVILEEGLPGLQRRPLDGPQDARNGPF
jgi:hypothetical protein